MQTSPAVAASSVPAPSATVTTTALPVQLPVTPPVSHNYTPLVVVLVVGLLIAGVAYFLNKKKGVTPAPAVNPNPAPHPLPEPTFVKTVE